jgi:hypothetical protein
MAKIVTRTRQHGTLYVRRLSCFVYSLVILCFIYFRLFNFFVDFEGGGGGLEKLRKATISFVMSVRSFVCMKQLGIHWTEFLEVC